MHRTPSGLRLSRLVILVAVSANTRSHASSMCTESVSCVGVLRRPPREGSAQLWRPLSPFHTQQEREICIGLLIVEGEALKRKETEKEDP